MYFGTIKNGFRSMTPKGFYDPIKGHTGLDIMMTVGTEIRLPFDVEVVDIRQQLQMGTVLYVKHGQNAIVFAHLSEVIAEVGKVYPKGSLLAKSGNSGTKTTAPHLHLEIIAPKPEKGLEMMTRSLGKFSGWNIDPTDYFEAKELSDMEWCKKYLPEVDWTSLPLNLCTAFRSLGKRVEWRQ